MCHYDAPLGILYKQQPRYLYMCVFMSTGTYLSTVLFTLQKSLGNGISLIDKYIILTMGIQDPYPPTLVLQMYTYTDQLKQLLTILISYKGSYRGIFTVQHVHKNSTVSHRLYESYMGIQGGGMNQWGVCWQVYSCRHIDQVFLELLLSVVKVDRTSVFIPTFIILLIYLIYLCI